MAKQQQKSGTAMSSCESELIAMSGGARDIQYMRNTFENLKVLRQVKATVLMSDSSAAISIADNSGMRDRTKHIALRYFQIRWLQKDRVVRVAKIGTDDNPSDIGTKALGVITFSRHRDILVHRVPSGGEARAGNNADKVGQGMAGQGIATEKVLSAIVALALNVASGEWITVRKGVRHWRPKLSTRR
jgi:hypothetical protein